MANETPCDRCGHVMEDVSVEHEQAREKGHDIQPALRRRGSGAQNAARKRR